MTRDEEAVTDAATGAVELEKVVSVPAETDSATDPGVDDDSVSADTAGPGDDDHDGDDHDGNDRDGDETDADDEVETVADDEVEVEVDEGEELFYEPGGSWWVVAIGPALIVAILLMEIFSEGQVHWAALSMFCVILVGFTVLQVAAARKHVSVRLTETTLRQGAQIIRLDEIAEVYPENRAQTHQKWESARALGELPAVPRRRKGVGVKLKDGGKLRQAWARDVDRFRSELTEAHLAVKLGLAPKSASKKSL